MCIRDRHYAADWMLFVLALLLVAKSLGGRATLNQHLGAVALSAAPAILFLLVYAPDLGDVASAPTAAALHYTGRILALVGVVWCGAVSYTHLVYKRQDAHCCWAMSRTRSCAMLQAQDSAGS